MNRTILAVALLILLVPYLLVAEGSPGGDPYSLHYMGFNTELDCTVDPDKTVATFLALDYLGLGMSYGYGRGWFRPRARANLSWMFGHGFTPTIGVEIPIIETLSGSMTKMFGFYVLADAGFTFSAQVEPVVRVVSHIRIPLGSLEGIGLGASWTSRDTFSLFVSRTSGVYPFVPNRK